MTEISTPDELAREQAEASAVTARDREVIAAALRAKYRANFGGQVVIQCSDLSCGLEPLRTLLRRRRWDVERDGDFYLLTARAVRRG